MTINARLDGGMGPDWNRGGDTRQHEVEANYDEHRNAVVLTVGYSDGSDWPDRFTRLQWQRFNERVLALFDAAERQLEIES